MIKQATQTKVCDSCGADIRPSALFCYHCGAQVASVSPSAENGKSAALAVPKDKTPKDSDERSNIKETPSEISPIEKKNARSNSGRLKAASAPRRKAVKTESNQAKFVWVEKDSESNVWFVVAAIVIALIALAVLMAMLYIK